MKIQAKTWLYKKTLCSMLPPTNQIVVWLLSPTLCDPMDYSLPGSSVHGIFQASILAWVAISFSWGSPWPRDWTKVSRIACRFLTTETPGKCTNWIQEQKQKVNPKQQNFTLSPAWWSRVRLGMHGGRVFRQMGLRPLWRNSRFRPPIPTTPRVSHVAAIRSQ